MKTSIPLFLLLSTALLFSAELTHINMGNQDFSLTTESYDIYDSKGTVLRMSSDERNNDLLFVLSLILRDASGTCAAKNVQEGSYEINGTRITLYSSWERKGRAYDTPTGARIQVFEVQADHSVKRISSKIYIEAHRENYTKGSGMEYLFKTPKTEEEKSQFSQYILRMERKYKGKFVFGKEAKQLKEEVSKALTRKLKSRWK